MALKCSANTWESPKRTSVSYSRRRGRTRRSTETRVPFTSSSSIRSMLSAGKEAQMVQAQVLIFSCRSQRCCSQPIADQPRRSGGLEQHYCHRNDQPKRSHRRGSPASWKTRGPHLNRHSKRVGQSADPQDTYKEATRGELAR